jgi:glutaredoxin
MIGRMPNLATRVVLYERDGCHLCEAARVLLDDMLGPDRYQRVDIDADDALLVRYGHRVPVIAVNGVDRLELLISGPEVRALAAELGERG